jgi:serralysin
VIGGGDIGGVSPNLSAGWSVAGIGDFNGDGKSDLLLQSVDGNGATTVAEWLMNGAEVAGGGVIGTLLDGWGVAGIGDFNGDGKSDILLQHSTGGVADALAEWQMNGTQVIGGGYINGVDPNLSTGWSAGGVGDFNGDGKADILLQGSHGQVAEWLMNGVNVIGGGVIGTVGAPWSVV